MQLQVKHLYLINKALGAANWGIISQHNTIDLFVESKQKETVNNNKTVQQSRQLDLNERKVKDFMNNRWAKREKRKKSLGYFGVII